MIQEARLRLQMRGQGSAAAERYRRLSHEFLAESEFDSFGLRQCLIEMDHLAGAPEPDGKGFFRRRFNGFATPPQAAMRASARALRAVEAILRRQDGCQRELEEKQIELESRIKKVEGRQP